MSVRREIFRFGTPRQETGSKHVPGGTLIEATNVRMVKAGVYSKRPGFDRTAHTFVGGSLSGTPASLLRGEYGRSLMRDTGGQLWERAPATNQWQYSGLAHTSWCESDVVLNQRYTSPMPFSCLVGTNIWVFALTSSAYDLTIVDTTSGAIVQQRIRTAATNIVCGSAAYDGTYVWVFWVDGTTTPTIKAHRFTAATPTVAPTATDAYTLPNAPVDVSACRLTQIKARWMPQSAGYRMFVVAAGSNYSAPNYTRACVHCVVQDNGIAVTVGGQAATLSVAYRGASGNQGIGGVYIHDGQDGSGAVWYYTVAGVVDTDYTTTKLVQVDVSQTLFSSYNRTTVESWTPLSTPPQIVNGAAFCSGSYQIVVRTVYDQNTASRFSGTQRSYSSKLWHVNGATIAGVGTDASKERFLWVASGFSKIGNEWYGVMALDDFGLAQTDFGTEATTTQRTYYPMRIVVGATAAATVFEIESQHANGSAPALWHKNTATFAIPSTNLPSVTTPHSYVVGTKMYTAVGFESGATGYVDVGMLEMETEKAYGQDCMMGTERGMTPGAIPIVWGNGDLAHEISPLVSPLWLRQSGGAGATFNVAAVVYVVTSPDGTVWRSAPKILTASILAGATLSAPALNIKTANATLEAEFYLGTTAPMLQSVVPFTSATVGQEVTYVTPATVGALIQGEVLYTWGGEISQGPPIPCTTVGYWKNRVLLAHDETVYVSSEHAEGFGPYLNEVQQTFWGDSTGEIIGMAPIDANYYALFADRGIAALSGAGPDRRGSGNFAIQSVSTMSGLYRGTKCLQGPAGCYYTEAYTRRIKLVTPSLQVVDCGGGAWDYGGPGAHATWYEAQKLMMFSYSDGFLVIDYQHPTEAAPYGQVYHWSVTNATYGMDVDNYNDSGVGGLIIVLSDGSVRRLSGAGYDVGVSGNSTYKMKLASAELQPSGMQGEFSLSMVQALVSVMSASGFTLTIYPAFASRIRSPAAANVSTKTVTFSAPDMPGDPQKVMHRPAYCGRIESFGFSIEESAGNLSASFEFEGFAIEYVPHGKLVYPSSGKVI